MTTKHAANLPAQPFAEAFAVAFAAGAAAMRLKQQGVYRADAPSAHFRTILLELGLR